jgi:hypothetical protein
LDGAEVKKDETLVEPTYDSDGETNEVVSKVEVPKVESDASPAADPVPEPEKPVKKVIKKKGP